MEGYQEARTALARLNNEFEVKSEYKTAFVNLDLLVLVKFKEDAVVRPHESSQFGYYKDGA